MMSLALKLGSSGPSHIHRDWLPWDVEGSKEHQATLDNEEINTTEKKEKQPKVSVHTTSIKNEKEKEKTVDCRMAPITEDCSVVGEDDCDCFGCIDDDDVYPVFF